MNIESFQNVSVACQHITEAREIAGGGFGEGHSAGMATGTRAKRFSFKQNDGFLWGEMFQPGSRGQARESTANDGKIEGTREFTFRCAKIDRPRAISPVFHGEPDPLRILCRLAHEAEAAHALDFSQLRTLRD